MSESSGAPGENSPGLSRFIVARLDLIANGSQRTKAGHATVSRGRRFNKLAPIHNFLAPSNKKFFQA
jgi:hypothetical protein